MKKVQIPEGKPRGISLMLGGNPKLIDKALATVDQLVLVHLPSQNALAAHPGLRASISVDYLTDTSFAAELCAALSSRFRVDGVIGLLEHDLLPAALIGEHLGLEHTSPETVRTLLDKWRMRQRLEAAGVSQVAAQLGTSSADIKVFAERHGFPLIVKPTAASSSFGVSKVSCAGEIPSLMQRLDELGCSVFLIEEFLDGKELSVEAFSFDGAHIPVAISDKIKDRNFVELGHSTPTTCSHVQQAAVLDCVTAFLDAVGLRFGPSHTEVILTSAGPKVVEGHNRRGGDRIARLVELVHGFDIEKVAIELSTGRCARPPVINPPSGGAAVRFMVADPGHLRGISGASDIANAPGVVEFHVNYKVGDEIPPVRWSLDRAGFVVVHAETAAKAIALAETYVAQIAFDVAEMAEDRRAALLNDPSLLEHLDQAGNLGR